MIQAPDIANLAERLGFQEILKNPILDIAARFWDTERYKAFKVCYRSMRAVDDLVDSHKEATIEISKAGKQQLASIVSSWQTNGTALYGTVQKQLEETREKFRIPSWPWERLAESMIYDVYHNGFRTFPDFLEYSEGAAVAPASVFMHLCGVYKENGHYRPPKFDVREAARSLALFCYIVHIIRDFQKDQSNNLNYFADSLLAENGLTPSMLKEIAAGGEISPGFRSLMGEYHASAEHYRRKARERIDKIGSFLEPRCLLSLELIYSLYLQIFERIDVSNGRFTSTELNPSPGEVREKISSTVSSFERTK